MLEVIYSSLNSFHYIYNVVHLQKFHGYGPHMSYIAKISCEDETNYRHKRPKSDKG